MLAVALKASAEFLTLFNARALPYISANFLSVCTGARANPNPNPNPDPDPNPKPKPNPEQVYTEALALIKHVQPSTRLLQTHCMSVKQRMATGAPALPRTLELEPWP